MWKHQHRLPHLHITQSEEEGQAQRTVTERQLGRTSSRVKPEIGQHRVEVARLKRADERRDALPELWRAELSRSKYVRVSDLSREPSRLDRHN
jgi:hypothetical protein